MNQRIGISAAEAFAGVGRSTLLRFAEAGYFSIERDATGSPLFLKQEISDLFNLQWEEPVVAEVQTSEPTPAPEVAIEEDVEYSTDQFESPPLTETEVVEVLEDEEPEPTIEAIVEKNSPAIEPNEDFGIQASTANEADFEVVESVKQLENEVLKLKRVIELQEQLLEEREADIADLKTQREWLQERVEKSEEKAERDQLLLISEMQMLTKLVAEQTRKRSPVLSILEWLGMREPTPAHTGNTIDYQTLKEKRAREQRQKEKAA